MDSAGIKAASYNGPPPITWAGDIVAEPKLVDKRNMDTGEVECWGNGDPKKQLLVIIQTDQAGHEGPDDDGRRGLWLEYRKKDAVVDAIKRAGQKGAPKKGAWLSLTYTGDDHSVKVSRGKQQPKMWAAEYRAPDPMAQVAGAQEAPQQGGWGQMPPAQPQPAQQSYIPPANPAGDPLNLFLAERNIDLSVMPREQGLMIARNLGYQGN